LEGKRKRKRKRKRKKINTPTYAPFTWMLLAASRKSIARR